jgi:heme oxygenase
LNYFSTEPGASPVVIRVRAATGVLHRQLEDRLDIVARLADPGARQHLTQRFAVFHLTAEARLRDYLAAMPGLDFDSRSRAPWLAMPASGHPVPPFPTPGCAAEALGMFYVIEGATLGGRIILRMLADKGIRDPSLGFLDPYGAETGARWRAFLSVMAREIPDDENRIAAACRGACAGFHHAERLLCEGAG